VQKIAPPTTRSPAESRESNGGVITQKDAVAAPPARCKNCDALLFGRFCANCGQAAEVRIPSTGELLHELLEGVTHSDSRLWRTLNYLWFKPGKLTQEFVAGRRVAYLPPFRLYLVLSIAFFLIASVSHTSGEFIHFDHPAASRGPGIESCEDIHPEMLALHPGWNLRLQHACNEIVRDNGANFVRVMLSTASKAMFFFLPLVAFLHMLMYRHPRFRFAEHLLFFVHLYALYFSAAILMLVALDAAHTWPKLQGAAGLLQTLLNWSVAIYTVIAVRRVFAKSWAGALIKSFALSIVYLVVLAITAVGVVVSTLLEL
jgi:Protein of unknown function (DUF3667)